MSIFRVFKNKNYTVMSNYHLKDKNLSLKAKGLLSLMLSLPDDWNYTINGLVEICKENESSITTGLSELKEFGYLETIKLMPNQTESGRFEYVYNIYEFPKQEGKKQDLEILGLEVQGLENIGLYKDTKELNTKELNTNSNLVDKTTKLQKEKNSKKGLDFGKTKRISQKDKLFHKLLDEILVKSKLYQNDTIRDLLIRWLNGLKEISKLPSSNSLEDSLLELEQYDEETIVSTINNSIKSNYNRFYIQNRTSSDGINKTRKVSDYEARKEAESYDFILEKYGNS